MNLTGTLTIVYLKILIVSIGNTTFAGAGTTFTAQVAVAPPSAVAVITAAPFATALIVPSAATVTNSG